jgi:hypothetical protein
MAVISGRVPNARNAAFEAIKYGIPCDIVDSTQIILYGDEAKASQVIAKCEGVITARKNMVRRRGH